MAGPRLRQGRVLSWALGGLGRHRVSRQGKGREGGSQGVAQSCSPQQETQEVGYARGDETRLGQGPGKRRPERGDPPCACGRQGRAALVQGTVRYGQRAGHGVLSEGLITPWSSPQEAARGGQCQDGGEGPQDSETPPAHQHERRQDAASPP